MEETKHLPRATVDDTFASGRACPICAETTLSVNHLDELPDYVQCSDCDSAFILDTYSDQAMYGSISADYPATAEYALKRWVALEAVQVKASAERAPTDFSSQPEEQAGPAQAGSAERAPTPPFGLGQSDDLDAPLEQPAPVEVPSHEPQSVVDEEQGASEPEPGQRFRVILSDLEAVFHLGNCAHCFAEPAPRRMDVAGDGGEARIYQIPLCLDCHRRATARSEEESNSRLVAHLSSLLVGAVMIVFSLAVGIIDFRGNLIGALLLSGVLGAIGYGIPAWLLLNRPTKFRPPADAEYVQSTVQIQPRPHSDSLSLKWRNSRYAGRFLASNSERAQGEVTKVYESGSLPNPTPQ